MYFSLNSLLSIHYCSFEDIQQIYTSHFEKVRDIERERERKEEKERESKDINLMFSI